MDKQTFTTELKRRAAGLLPTYQPTEAQLANLADILAAEDGDGDPERIDVSYYTQSDSVWQNAADFFVSDLAGNHPWRGREVILALKNAGIETRPYLAAISADQPVHPVAKVVATLFSESAERIAAPAFQRAEISDVEMLLRQLVAMRDAMVAIYPLVAGHHDPMASELWAKIDKVDSFIYFLRSSFSKPGVVQLREDTLRQFAAELFPKRLLQSLQNVSYKHLRVRPLEMGKATLETMVAQIEMTYAALQDQLRTQMASLTEIHSLHVPELMGRAEPRMQPVSAWKATASVRWAQFTTRMAGLQQYWAGLPPAQKGIVMVGGAAIVFTSLALATSHDD